LGNKDNDCSFCHPEHKWE